MSRHVPPDVRDSRQTSSTSTPTRFPSYPEPPPVMIRRGSFLPAPWRRSRHHSLWPPATWVSPAPGSRPRYSPQYRRPRNRRCPMGTSIRPCLARPAPTPPPSEGAFLPTRSTSWPGSSPRSSLDASHGHPFPSCRPMPMTVFPHPSSKAFSSLRQSIPLHTRNSGTPLRLLPSDLSRIQENQSIARAARQGRSPRPTVLCIRTRTSPLESEPCHSCPECLSPLPRSRPTIPSVPGPTKLWATRDR